MNRNHFFMRALALLAMAIYLPACSEDEDKEPDTYSTGYFVSNEGAFGNSNGSLGFWNTGTNTYVPNALGLENQGFVTGDVVQSLLVTSTKVWVVVNNSNRIVVADRGSLTIDTVLEGLALPRYLLASGNSLYLTEWVGFGVNGRLRRIDPQTYAISQPIELGELPERLAASGQTLYVANSSGQTVDAIDLASFTKVGTWVTGDRPNSVAVDASGDVWVLQGGNPSWTGTFSHGSLKKFSNQGQELLEVVLNQEGEANARNLWWANNQAWFLIGSDIYTYAPGSGQVSEVVNGANAYGFSVDASNSLLLVGENGNFSDPSDVVLYSLSGQEQKRIQAEIAPNYMQWVP